MIAELRQHTKSSAWASWTKRLYALINGEDITSDDISTLKSAVEQSITRRLGMEE
jgi:Fe-S cluster biosynthesis and repair protein YggX